MNLRNKIITKRKLWITVLITIVIVTTIVVLAVQSLNTAVDATIQEFNQRQQVLAKESAKGIEVYFETIARGLKSLSKIPSVEQLDEKYINQEFQRRFDEFEPLGVNDIGLLNSKGILIHNITAPWLLNSDFSWRQYYKKLKLSRSRSDIEIEFITFQGADAGKQGIIIATPIFNNSETSFGKSDTLCFNGVIVCTVIEFNICHPVFYRLKNYPG